MIKLQTPEQVERRREKDRLRQQKCRQKKKLLLQAKASNIVMETSRETNFANFLASIAPNTDQMGMQNTGDGHSETPGSFSGFEHANVKKEDKT